jgi:hypothetical protein
MNLLGEKMAEIRAGFRSMKITFIVTAMASVLSIVLGVATFNAAVLSNMLAAFESGQNMTAQQMEVRRQLEATATLLRQVQEENANRRQQQ